MTASASRSAILANALGYQAVWFACVLGAAQGLAWPGALASALFTAATLAWGGCPRRDLGILLILLPLGLGMDSVFAAMGWVHYAAPGPWGQAAPIWIAAIWMSFGMTLNHSLSFLRRRPWLAALLGLVGAPLAYWSASRGFGVIHFSQPATAILVALAMCWSVLLPLAFGLDSGLRQRLQVAA